MFFWKTWDSIVYQLNSNLLDKFSLGGINRSRSRVKLGGSDEMQNSGFGPTHKTGVAKHNRVKNLCSDSKKKEIIPREVVNVFWLGGRKTQDSLPCLSIGDIFNSSVEWGTK